jgi:hypothetical protein
MFSTAATELSISYIAFSFLLLSGVYGILRLAKFSIQTRKFSRWAAENGCESGPSIYTNFFAKIRYKFKLGMEDDMLEGKYYTLAGMHEY